jgi:hypothetical protein
MGAVADFVEDAVEDVVDVVGDAIEDVGEIVGDAVETVGQTIENVVNDPLPTIIALAGQAVGIPAPVTMAAITGARGGDLKDMALAAATAYVAPVAGAAIGSTVSTALSTAIGNQAVSTAIGNAVSSGLVSGTLSEVRGGDFSDGFAGGFTGSIVGSGVKEAVDYVRPEIAGVIQKAGVNDSKAINKIIATGTNALAVGLTSQITGRGDFDTAFTNSLVSQTLNAGKDYLKNSVRNEFNSAFGAPLAEGDKFVRPDPSSDVIDTKTVTDDEGNQFVYDSNNNLIDIIPGGSEQAATDKTPQQRSAEEWQRYLDSLENPPDKIEAEGSTIEAGPYWDEYNKNLQRIMDEGGYTSQWQTAAGERVFVNDDGTAIGINENGESYALDKTQVDEMVKNGLLNTEASGYAAAIGASNRAPAPSGSNRGVSGGAGSGAGTGAASGAGSVRGGGNQSPAQSPTAPAAPISRAVQDEPMRRIGLPIYDKMQNFEGPLSDFLEMVQKGSYTSQPEQPEQSMQSNMSQQMQPDRLDQPATPGGSYFNYGQESSIDSILKPGNELQTYKQGGMASPLMAAGGTTRYGMNSGGALDVVHHSGKPRLDFREGAAVTGEGDGQSDDIPAMLADGEFVFPADVVAALGNGSTKAGSDKLYEMMHSIRAHHRSAKPEDLPPPAKKSPLDYLKKPAKKAKG